MCQRVFQNKPISNCIDFETDFALCTFQKWLAVDSFSDLDALAMP